MGRLGEKERKESEALKRQGMRSGRHTGTLRHADDRVAYGVQSGMATREENLPSRARRR